MSRLPLSDAERRLLLDPSRAAGYALRDRDAQGVPLAGLHLGGAVVVNVSFIGANFTDARLQNTTFEKCDFRGGDFTRAVIEQVRFIDCDHSSVRGDDVALADVDFIRCSATDLKFEGGRIERSGFDQFKSEQMVLRAMRIEQVDWNNCELSRPKIEECHLTKVTFAGCTLTVFKFTEGELRNVTFKGGALRDGGVDRVRVIETNVEAVAVQSLRFFGGGQFMLRFIDCPVIDALGFDSCDLNEVRLSRCKSVQSMLILNSNVTRLLLEAGPVLYMDISDSRVHGMTLHDVTLTAPSFMGSNIDDLAVESSEIGGRLRIEGAAFQRLRLSNVRYGAGYTRNGNATYAASGSFQ